MRRMWDNKQFFSFFEHLDPSQIQDIFKRAQPAIMGMKRTNTPHIPYVALFVRRSPENEEVSLNHTIGIA